MWCWSQHCAREWQKGMHDGHGILRRVQSEANGFICIDRRYVCEEMGVLKDDVLEQEAVNSVLTAVVQGMRKEETDHEVRPAACILLVHQMCSERVMKSRSGWLVGT